MLYRISNPADPSPVPLEDVSLQYWFDGPDPAAVLASFSSSSGAPPAVADQFKLVCSDTSPGLGEQEFRPRIHKVMAYPLAGNGSKISMKASTEQDVVRG